MAEPTAPTQTTDFNSQGDFGGFLKPEMAAPIFEKAAHQSVVMRLVRQIPMGANGVEIPYVTSRPSVAWVGEAQRKKSTSGALGLKSVGPKKVAAILVVSAEVVRANPGNYLNVMRESLSEAFALAFDRAALHDEGPDGEAGGGPFATFLDQATHEVELGTAADNAGGVYSDLVNALAEVTQAQDAQGRRRYHLNGWAFDAVVEPVLLGALDANGRPLFTDLRTNEESTALLQAPGVGMTAGRVLHRPAFMAEGVSTFNMSDVVGYGGDWSQAVWGVTSGISYDISTQATVTLDGELVSLWENNLVAIRAEAEYGFLLNDPAAFVKLTNEGNDPQTSA